MNTPSSHSQAEVWPRLEADFRAEEAADAISFERFYQTATPNISRILSDSNTSRDAVHVARDRDTLDAENHMASAVNRVNRVAMRAGHFLEMGIGGRTSRLPETVALRANDRYRLRM